MNWIKGFKNSSYLSTEWTSSNCWISSPTWKLHCAFVNVCIWILITILKNTLKWCIKLTLVSDVERKEFVSDFDSKYKKLVWGLHNGFCVLWPCQSLEHSGGFREWKISGSKWILKNEVLRHFREPSLAPSASRVRDCSRFPWFGRTLSIWSLISEIIFLFLF